MAAPTSGNASNTNARISADKTLSVSHGMCASVTNERNTTQERKESSDDASKEEKRGMYSSYQHNTCLRRVNFATQHHPRVKFLLEAINKLGSEFAVDKQVSCERCTADTNVSGGFDPVKNEIIICENRSLTQRLTSMLMVHELIHAYDHHKARVDWTDLEAVACSEVRAANLSGDCSLLSEKFYRLNLGAKHNNEACVRRHAVSSIIATRDLSREDAEKIVDSVWGRCFHDYTPFADIPHRAADMKFSRFSKYYDPR